MWEELIKAIRDNNVAKVAELIGTIDQKELNDKKDQGGDTVLTLAAWKGMKEVCKLLIPKMTPEAINTVTKNGNTALTLAASKGMKEVCEMLIPKMSPEAINTVTKSGNTALTWAAWKGTKEVCEMLIPKMSPKAISIVNNNGCTALILAAKKGMKEACKLLIPKMSAEAINAASKSGKAALLWVAESGMKEVCGLLISKMSFEAIDGALALAVKNNQNNVVQFIKLAQESVGEKAEKAAAEAKAKEAEGRVLAGEYDQALIKYDEAIKFDPNNKSYHTNKALVLNKLAKYTEAIEAVERALSIDPEYQEAKTCKAFALNGQQKEEIIKMKEQEILKAKEATIHDISKLIAEGNARIQDTEEKGILIMGKTKAGKSTLTHLLAKQELKGIFDKEQEIMCVDAVNPLENIKIGQESISETTVPNKCRTGDTVIWDCPGFNDTGGIAQEIANSFYIRRLFETTKQLKFILAISYSNEATNYIQVVDQFVKGFTDIKGLKNSVALVITKVPSGKTAGGIKNIISKNLEQNSKIENNTKEMVQFLLKSVHIFKEPAEGEVIKESNLLSTINDSITYLDVTPDLANIAISSKFMSYAEELLGTTYANLNKTLNIIAKAVEESNKCMRDNNENIFVKSYDEIEDWIPSSLEYAKLERLPKHNNLKEYFLDLDQLSALQKTFQSLQVTKDHNLGQKTFLKILEVFEEFVIDSDVTKLQIQKYAHILGQQIEYIKFFSRLCEKEVANYGYVAEIMEKCTKVINAKLEHGIKSIKLDTSQSDIPYYLKAITYLSQDPSCAKTAAEAYCIIGNRYELTSKSEALSNYIQALKLDNKLSITYEKIGDLLFNHKQYPQAIKCFKVADNSIKIENCFKELVKQKPNDSKIRIEKGDYYLSIGRYDKAIGCYKDASSLSSSQEGSKAEAYQKISNVLTLQSQELAAKAQEYGQKAKDNNFYNFEEIKSEDLENYQLLITGNNVELEATIH